MVNRRFGESKPGVLKALHHLDAYCSARRVEPYTVIAFSPDKSEITVDISDFYTEGSPHHPAIGVTKNNPMKRVGTTYLVPIDDIYSVGHQRR
jgi:hypothetical protein